MRTKVAKTVGNSGWALFLAVLGSASLVAFAGCTRTPAGPDGASGVQTPSELLSSALATLRTENPNVTTYRSAVQQFNNFLDQKPELRDQLTLSDAAKTFIKNEVALDQRDPRLAELERKSFTPLDSYHLDSRLLFRDAVRSIQTMVGPEPTKAAEKEACQQELARLTFEWLVRQVQLQPRIRGIDDPRAAEIVRRFNELGADQLQQWGIQSVGDALGRGFWPAHEVLRRGTGDAEERTRILLGLFEQLGVPCGVLTRTVEVQNEDKREQREITWVVGAVFGKDILLFDPLLGTPLVGPGGKGIATLRQAQSDPTILKAHYQALEKDPDLRKSLALCQYDSSHPVIATPAQLAKPSLYLLSELSSLSPRMRQLQTWLDDDNNHAVLHEDLQARLQELRTRDLGVQVSAWRSRDGYPTVVLAKFLEDPFRELRRQAVLSPRAAYIPAWVHKLAADLRSPERAREIYSRYDNYVMRIRLEPGGVRDLLVRGRPELAVEKIVEAQANLDRALGILFENNDSERLSKQMREDWGPEVVRLVATVNQLKVDAEKAPPNSEEKRQLTERMRAEEKRFDAVWKENRGPMGFLTIEWSEPLVREHLVYFMALSKMELALRAEYLAGKQTTARGKDQLTPSQKWQSAEDWFDRYQALVLAQPRSQWATAAEQHRAACRKATQRLAANN